MIKWKHKKIGMSITLDKSVKLGMMYLLDRKIRESQKCMNHEMSYCLISNPYRRYRRGKNRCSRCGLRQG